MSNKKPTDDETVFRAWDTDRKDDYTNQQSERGFSLSRYLCCFCSWFKTNKTNNEKTPLQLDRTKEPSRQYISVKDEGEEDEEFRAHRNR